ncbi:MAG: DNA primase [Gammaproteobacteria bacterium]|nr:DNA primase [Gammaproteobacteria bacterium]
MAGRIPQSFIDELLTRTDIFEVVDPRVQLKKAGREYTACCPFHNEKTPSFTVSPSKQFYHCFGCGAHGSAIGFLMEYDHLNFPEAVEELARMNGMEVPREEGPAPDPKARQRQNTLYDLMAQTDRFYRQQLRQHPQAKKAINYLKQRGLSGEIAAAFGLGYAPPGWDNLLKTLGSDEEKRKQLTQCGMLKEKEDGKYFDFFRDRIMFPIRDQRGRTIAFGGRILGDDKPKYLNSPETPLFHKGRELYGLFEMKQALRKIDRIMVVEGYMDVVALAQFDIRYAVATLGTATTPEHLNRLFRVCPEVVFCFDGDRAGRDAAWRALDNALPILKEGHELRFLFLPDGEDPDTLVRKEGKAGFEKRLDTASPLSRYFFDQMSSQIDMQSLDGRARLVELARPYLAKLPKGLFRQMMLEHLANLAKVDRQAIEVKLQPNSSNPATEQSKQPTRPRQRSSLVGNAPFTPIRRVIALLLHYPHLVNQLEDENSLLELQQKGVPFLRQLLEMIHQHPNITSAVLLERWRETDHWPHLDKLLAWNPMADAGVEIDIEFRAAVEALLEQPRESRADHLLTKSEQGPLSSAEKAELQQLLSRTVAE